MTVFSESHLNILKECKRTAAKQAWAGASPKLWFDGVDKDFAAKLPDENLSRVRLFEEVAKRPTIEAVAIICAWGGMRYKNRDLFFPKESFSDSFNKIEGALEEIRHGSGTRQDHFKLLHDHKAKGDMPGMGIAYYSKLLFFLRKKRNAYIMDQWTAKSMNLLVTTEPVALIGGYVSNANSPEDYERFCSRIDALAEELAEGKAYSGAEAEELIFSNGGHPAKKGAWRTHVNKHFPRKNNHGQQHRPKAP